jgi:hypothetical protein
MDGPETMRRSVTGYSPGKGPTWRKRTRARFVPPSPFNQANRRQLRSPVAERSQRIG